MAVSEFAVVKDSLNGMEVNYYVDKDYEPYAKDIFNNTTEMITFYSELLGYDYPWSKYSQVIVHDYVSGAMENVGAVIFGDFVHQTKREMIDGNNESTVAHELFHHWFGDVVTCESWSNLPLNESFATYGEYLWHEYKYGILTADAALQNDLDSYLSEVRHGDAKDMIRFHYNKPDDMFDSHSYAKGGRILHMLRSYVGDDAFFASLKLYLHDNEFTSVEIHQLRLAFEEVTGEDLNWFFNQWFMGKGHPDLDITYTYDEASMTQSVLVEQLQDIEDYALFKLPVEIDVYVGGKKETHSVIVDSVKQTFSFKVSVKPDLVNFDSKKILLCTKTENHTMSEMIFMYENAPLYKDKREAVLFAYNEEVELDVAKKLIRKAMTDEAKSIRVLAISKYDMFDEDDVDVQKVLISVLQNDPNSEARYEATFALSDLFIDADEMVNVFESQLKIDSSYLVISGLLGSIAVADSTLGLKYAKQFETEDNSDILYSCAEVYSVYGNESNYDFFIDLYPKSESYEVMSFLMYCQDYLMLIDAPEKQPAMLDIYEKEAKSELAWFVRYYAVSGLVNLKEHYISMAKMNRKDAKEDKAMLYDELIERIDADLTSLRVTETDNRVFMQR
jgi:aminopeptidase N